MLFQKLCVDFEGKLTWEEKDYQYNEVFLKKNLSRNTQ
jgi:hypothetical protein